MKSFVFSFTLLSLLMFSHCNLDEVDAVLIDITGRVSDNGTAVSGAIVLLIEASDITDGVSLSNGSISLANGNYTIIEPAKGKYYVVAIDDVNSNFQYDEGIDRFGFHGVNPGALDFTPKRITVGSSDLENIDIVYLTAL